MYTANRISQLISLSGKLRQKWASLALILSIGLIVSLSLNTRLSEARWNNSGNTIKTGETLTAFVPVVAVSATITVNDLGNAVSNDGKCTLREAIIAANTNTASGAAVGECAAGMAGADNIVFNVGAGTPTINLTSPLPAITESITISGNTGGATRVELNGAGAGAGANGLTINASNCVIERLVINRFSSGAGIRIASTVSGLVVTSFGSNTIKGCIIGLDSSGTMVSANNIGVEIVGSSNNTIGSTVISDRNTISGNTTNGILINRIFITNPNPDPPTEAAASGNKIINSYIGTDVTGRFDLGNGGFGVNVVGGNATVIGGATPEERNVISGNNGGGVRIAKPSTATTALAQNNRILGNYIGLDASTLFQIGNGVFGAGGMAPGVLIENAPNNAVGGAVDGEFNFIKYNLQNGGVVVTGAAATGNTILRNYISNNVGLGIDLVSNGNNNQASPALTGVSLGNTSTTISGFLSGPAFQDYRIEFFFSSQCDSSGSGEGENYLGGATNTPVGFINVSTGLFGIANFSPTFNNFVAPAGSFLTATATRLSAGGAPIETSEFSVCLGVPPNDPPTCNAAFVPQVGSFRIQGGTSSISVYLKSGCPWTASSILPWVSIASGASGNGNGTVVINVSPNPGDQRIGQISIAGKNYNITQEGNCTASLNPIVKNYAAAGGNGVVELITGAGCAWTVSNPNAWITINSATSGSGPTFVDFTVAPYSGTFLRVGTIIIGGQSFSVIQDPPCGSTISPSSQSVVAAGGNYSTAITIPAGCNWSATKTDSWITLNAPTSGMGNGTLSYTVAANNGAQRTGVITVAGKSLAISQDSACLPTFNPTSQTIGAGAGSHSFGVNISGACNWTAETLTSWITITSGTGMGNGTVTYSVTANPGAQRVGTISLSGRNIAITQDGACSYSLSKTLHQMPIQGGTDSVNVNATSGCGWTATSQTPWIVITSGASGTGNGTVNYLVATNGTGSQRNGVMNIAGIIFSVQQDGNGNCTYTVSPLTQNAPASGGAFTTSVTVAGGCAWTASSNVSWINITSSFAPNRDEKGFIDRNPSIKNGIAGTGNGTVGYSVQANTGPPRTGTIFAAGELVTVNQASGCPDTVSPANLSNGQIGVNYSQQLTSANGVGTITWSVSSGSEPPGLMLNPSSGLLSGIPTVPGTFGFTVRATGTNGCYGEASYMLVINCQPLSITTLTLPNAVAGASYNQQISLSGGSGQINWGISAGSLPPGITLHPTSGVISGAATVIGPFSFTVKATVNSTGCFATQAYSITVGCQTITVNEASLAIATLNASYNQTVTQSGGIGIITWSVSAGSLPTGLMLSSGGQITGTPTVLGSSPVTLRATDANSCFGEKAFTLMVNCPSFNITPATLNQGTVNAGYSQQLMQTGAMNSVTWSLQASSLPTNLTLSSGGLISGTPNVAGSFPVTVRATESVTGCFTDKAYTLVINCQTINVSPATLPGGTVGTPYNQSVSQTGGVGTITWSVSAGSLPTGLGLNSTNGAITGTPTVSGPFNFTARATDGNGCFGERGYSVVIGCQSLSISPATLNPIPIAMAYSQQLTLQGAIGTTDWTIVSGAPPSGVTLNQTSGLLSGTPNVSGTFNFTVKALQTSGCFAQQAYTLTVNCPTINITPTTLNAANLGVPYSQQFSQTGGVGSITWSVESGTLPSNINLSANGLLSGTPIISGNFPITIRATDSNGCFGQLNYTFVVGTCPTISISPGTLPSGLFGTNYNQALSASGGTPGYNFTFTGNLPSGITLSTAGVLSGSPNSVGSFDFTVTATDQNGCAGSKAYTLIICSVITVNPMVLPGGVVGSNYSQNLTALGGGIPHNFTFSGTLPNGLTLMNDGLLSGIPTLSGTFNFIVTATDTSSCTGSRSYSVVITGPGLVFYPLAHPLRILDTRPGSPACDMPGQKIPGGTSRLQTAAGRTCDSISIPASARALTGNITTVQSGGGYLTLYPSDAMQPAVANSNFQPNQVLNNVFTVGLGAGDGAFKIFVATSTDVVVDITGYYAPPGAGGLYFHPLTTPVRMLDTRAGQIACDTPGAPIAGGVERTQQGRIFCNGITIPSGALALVGNATAVTPSGQGFLTLYPGDALTKPLAASSNYASGQTMNGPFTVGLGADGTFKIYSSATTDLVIDVLGYYSPDAVDLNGPGLLFTPLGRPVRLLETRMGQPGCYTPGAALAAGSTRIQQALGICDGMTVGANAQAIVGNATVVAPANNGFLTFWPSDAAQPGTANSNYRAGTVFNRHITVGLGADGAFKIFTSATTNLVVDISGYFAP